MVDLLEQRELLWGEGAAAEVQVPVVLNCTDIAE